MEKRCVQCGEIPPSGWYRSKRNKDGLDSYCKACRDGRGAALRAKRRAERPIPVRKTEKACTRCGEVKRLDEFHVRRTRGEGARKSVCKACDAAIHAEYVSRPAVAEHLRRMDRSRRTGSLKRPRRREPLEGCEVCTVCNEDAPLDQFHAHKLGRNGKDSTCKECRRVLARERNKDPERQERDHRRSRESRFGMYRGQYDDMLAAQGGECAICGDPPTTRRLHVDHCHDSGRVRALLCSPCNQGLGSFRDNAAVMQKAVDYLLSHASQARRE